MIAINQLPVLPAEIWLTIFRFAIDLKHHRNQLYIPFEPTNLNTPISPAVLRLRTPSHLSIGSKVQALRDVFENGGDLGSLVHSAVILNPNKSGSEPPSSILQTQVLKHCTRLVVLVQLQYQQSSPLSQRFSKTPSFDSLQRLEWWSNAKPREPADITSLISILRHAPNIQHLFIGGHLTFIGVDPITLPKLKTLRLYLFHGEVLEAMAARWTFPALRNVVFCRPVRGQGMLTFWQTFGPQLDVVEIGPNPFVSDVLGDCLEHCPNLKEINYSLFNIFHPRLHDTESPIHTVGLLANIDRRCLLDGYAYWGRHSGWNFLEQHFVGLLGEAFPFLERIVLYGDWSYILSDERFESIHARLHAQRCTLELEDGTLLIDDPLASRLKTVGSLVSVKL
ncbi:hypothetical protein BD779DRAFT_1668184 [Infundibulicybe gibba]|nr:hypothetical protein BD779DRAFT_1668184 [Infundibulicybe gibba]